MSFNLYQTGVSGLLSSQQQLATTGHNIANVNTEGYNRQRAEQTTLSGDSFGGNFLGSGTYVDDITRLYNKFSYKEQLLNSTNLGESNALHASLTQLNEIMSTSGNQVSSSIDRFYTAINSIADNPSDLGLRNIALTQAGILASDLQSISKNFDQLENSTNNEINQVASKITEISHELAKINESILQNKGFGAAGQPNDLLDKRDQLITELSQFTSVNTVSDKNGVMTVMIGSGATLVAGLTPLSVNVVAGDPDPNKTSLEIAGANGSVALSQKTLGGQLGAKFAFRDNYLDQTRRDIDRLAMAISETLNASQADGLDLNQIQGANLFTDINSPTLMASRVLTPASNAGSLTAEVSISDISLVPADEFQITFDGANYQMRNMTTGTVDNLGAPGSGTYTTAYGFEFVETGGAPSANDSFVIRPTENSAALIEAQITDGAAIAAATPVAIRPSDNNVSPGKIEIVNMIDPVAARAEMPMRIDILENPVGVFNYTITDKLGVTSAPIPYTPPTPPATFTVDLPPAPATAQFQVNISGTPSGSAPNAPEQFFIEDAYGIGNGSNAVDMALTQEQGIINGGRESFSKSLGVSTANVGSKAASAELVADTAQALFTQAYNRNQETSGVNLDEEAANLLRFQQAYQAASQIISTANTIFDTLLAVAR
ncbi:MULTISPECIES: flagellar hook-associated protein FlgK [Thalassotalea]|uniref:flagellar hook-associated protein FlgK n=1 Tax=Thalassotalea TaxID=1518149 RepID=UPI0009431BD1|nr:MULTISPECIES: flagellar hook-associated protein FlgK [Thalassotalea]OKY24709.1 flagellar hook-associated protein FlgK [Thalassotalea sp. PP2-459]